MTAREVVLTLALASLAGVTGASAAIVRRYARASDDELMIQSIEWGAGEPRDAN